MNSQSGVLGHNSLECKRVPRGSWLGASRREYPAYCQGAQRRHGPRGARPKGGSANAHCRVALLGNIPDIPCEARLALDAGRPS